MVEPDLGRNAASSPVLDPLHAVLLKAEKFGDLGGAAETLDQFFVTHRATLNTMFNQWSTLCLSTSRLLPHNRVMHESVTRLLEYARRKTAATANAVETFMDLQVRLAVSSATMTNWKVRGVSKSGAIAAEKEFGCSVSWVLTGKGEEDSDARVLLAMHKAFSPALGAKPSLRTAIEYLAEIAAKQRPTLRKNMANLLVELIEHPDDPVLVEQTVKDVERFFEK